MNNPNAATSAQFPFPYDPNVYQSNALLNGLSLNNSIDTNANPMAAANFPPYNYGFHGFGDSLNFPHLNYFNNQQAAAYFPTTNIPTTSTPLSTPTQTPSIYQQNINQFSNSIKLPSPNEEIRSVLPIQKPNEDKLTVGQKTKPKRKRILFTTEQVRILEEHFTMSQQTQTTERNLLAKQVGLTPQQIKIWFQNRRYKEKVARREFLGSSVQKVRPVVARTSPINENQSANVDQEKLGVKQDVGMQGGASAMPQIYPNWSPAAAQTPLFPFQADMYANSFSALQPGIGYPQMFSEFQNSGALNPLSLAYYNPTNEPTPNAN